MSADDSSSRTTAIESRPSCPAGEAHSSRARAQIYDTNRSGWKKRATTSRSLSPPVVPIDRFSLRIISTSARGAETARVRALRLPPAHLADRTARRAYCCRFYRGPSQGRQRHDRQPHRATRLIVPRYSRLSEGARSFAPLPQSRAAVQSTLGCTLYRTCHIIYANSQLSGRRIPFCISMFTLRS